METFFFIAISWACQTKGHLEIPLLLSEVNGFDVPCLNLRTSLCDSANSTFHAREKNQRDFSHFS